MTARDFEQLLTEAIEDFEGWSEEGETPRVRTFAKEGILTTDRGLVVRFQDDEFQVTIIRAGGDED